MEKLVKETSDVELLANNFFDLYRGLKRAYGNFKILTVGKEEEKIKGRARTEIKPYIAALWKLHLNGEEGLGVIPIQDDNTCQWGSIDIDVYDLDIVALEKKVQDLGLPLITIKSKSGGAHLTMFLNEPVSCKFVRGKLYEFAIALGHGGVEIFPKQNTLASNSDVGNWLNMPYFEYKDSQRYAILNGQRLTAFQFIDLAHQVRISFEQLKGIVLDSQGELSDGPPCLQMLSKSGVPEGTRNNALFAFAVYCRKKYDDDWQDRVEKMNVAYFNPPLKSSEVQTVIKSCARKNYFYPCNKTPLCNVCNKEICKKRNYGIGESEEFNINLGSLTKIMSDPPIWIIDIEGSRAQLDTEDLMNQQRFRKLCLNSVNKLPPIVKNSEWEAIVRDKLQNVEIIEAPCETKSYARLFLYAVDYLATMTKARNKDEILQGKPWLDEAAKLFYFRGFDLIKFMELRGAKVDTRQMWMAIKNNGGEQAQLNVKRSNLRLWTLPAHCVEMDTLDLPDTDIQEF